MSRFTQPGKALHPRRLAAWSAGCRDLLIALPAATDLMTGLVSALTERGIAHAGLQLLGGDLEAASFMTGRPDESGHRVATHRRVMLAAFGVSALFLAFYVAHKWSRGFENTPFEAEGALRLAYLILLGSHVVLAMTVPALAVAMVALGLRGRIPLHRRLARVVWPVWMYVSVTGVVIYILLYHLNPGLG